MASFDKNAMEDGVEYAQVQFYKGSSGRNAIEFYGKRGRRVEQRPGAKQEDMVKELTRQGWTTVYTTGDYEGAIIFLERIARFDQPAAPSAEPVASPPPVTPVTPAPPAPPVTPAPASSPRPKREWGISRDHKRDMEDGVEYARIVIDQRNPDRNAVEVYDKKRYTEQKHPYKSKENILSEMIREGWSEVFSGGGHGNLLIFMERYAPPTDEPESSASLVVSDGRIVPGGFELNAEALLPENHTSLPPGLTVIRAQGAEGMPEAIQYSATKPPENFRPHRTRLDVFVDSMVQSHNWQILRQEDNTVYLGKME